jgi:hypothetical protein
MLCYKDEEEQEAPGEWSFKFLPPSIALQKAI